MTENEINDIKAVKEDEKRENAKKSVLQPEIFKQEEHKTYEEIYDELIQKIKQYHPSSDFTLIEKAYKLALAAHGDQIRKSGEPYIIHPLSTAVILADLEMDRETIAAGILHDVIEDTKYTYADITNEFNEEIANLVDGVTKLEKLQYSSFEDEQAENYRKMFLAMSNDIRVIIIKIADRLHNMRTIKYMEHDKQIKIAQETLDIYCPLAHRLGISKIRYELEDISFRCINPEAYYDLKDKIQRKQSEREAIVAEIVEHIKQKLAEEGIEAYVEGRPKHFFSIYKKMKQQDKTLDQIYDLFAVRAIVNTVRDCYEVLGVMHQMYTPIPSRFKDYIAMPRSNMYQSLHNTLIGPGGEPFEVQIRTWEMHRTAEYGIAAHWKYKSNDGASGADKEEEKLAWLRQMLEWSRDFSDNREFLDMVKFDLNVFKDHVYCFTPKGQVIAIQTGSTPIDFAYAIHSAVGNKMIGAKVNNKIVPIDCVLATGDRVEILTSQNSKGPSRDWLKIVKTSQARSKINQWFKKENREENIVIGKDALERGAKKKGVALSSLLSPERVAIILNKFSLLDWDSVCAAVGHGSLKEGQVINRLKEEYDIEAGKAADNDALIQQLIHPADKPGEKTKKTYKNSSGVIIKGAGDIMPRFSKCCGAVPGDEIVAFVTRGRGVSIHRSDCLNILHLDDLEKHRVIEAEWQLPDKPDASGSALFRADIRLTCDDRMGLLVDISRVLTNENMSVSSLNARIVKNAAVFSVGLSIASKEQLETISKKLLNLPGVRDVERISI